MKRSDLLVVGFGGTLRASADGAGRGLAGSSLPGAGRVDAPPRFKELLDRLVEGGVSDLVRRAPAAYLVFRGEAVPLGGLLELLRERLGGLLMQAIDGSTEDYASAEKLLQKLPELWHLLRATSADWVGASLTFLGRLRRDQSIFTLGRTEKRLPPIAAVSGCASDVHAGSHSVLRVQFAGGGAVYYKPRPVTAEWLWHDLLERIGQHDSTLCLPAARVLDRGQLGSYGWVASLLPEEQGDGDPAAGRSRDKSLSYWHRAGAALCLAQHVNMTDLHLGNMLATPEGPAIADAECLGTPGLRERRSSSMSNAEAFGEALHSLLATGLLPRAARSGSVEVSGLFGQGGPVAGVLLPRWTTSDSGSYHLQGSAAELMDHRNRPGEAATPAAVLPALAAGYRHAAEVLLRMRESLLAPRSEWKTVLEQQHAPRVVVRETLLYAGWISRSLAPEYLRSHPLRRSALKGTFCIEARGGPLSPALLRAEVHAMLCAQVPRFMMPHGTTTLARSSGGALVLGFSAETPAGAVYAAMNRLSRNHLDDALLPALLAACLMPG